MTFTQIKYVVETARAGSINKAAQRLFVSQSALSVAIKNLEIELGHPIFARITRGVTLTPFGKAFISYVSPIYTQIRNLDRMVFHASEPRVATFAFTSAGWSFLTRILSDMFNQYSKTGIRIEIHEGLGIDTLEYVANGTAEIGFDRRYTCHRIAHQNICKALSLQFFVMYTADVGITVGKGSPLFHLDQTVISPDMLRGCTPIVHGYTDAGPYADIFEKLRLPSSRSRFYATSRAAWSELLHRTNSYFINSVLPTTMSRDHHSWPRKTFRLEGARIKSEFGWFKRIDATPSSIAVDLIGRISENFAESPAPDSS